MMKYAWLKIATVALLASLALTACTTARPTQAELDAVLATNSQLTAQVAALSQQVALLEEQLESTNSGLLPRALMAVNLIADADFAGLAQLVHPAKGLRFSPYGYVDVANDLVFTAAEVSGFSADTTLRTWGSFDGTGLPIVMAFAAYYDRFVYDQDFTNPQFIGINSIIGRGNTLINLDDVYPNAAFIEFHFSSIDPQYEGMDWRSLRLVFEEQGGQWLLVGIIHDEWTI